MRTALKIATLVRCRSWFAVRRSRILRRGSHHAAILAIAIFGATLNAQLIDRVLAVVSGTPITLSDVNAATTFGFLSQTPGTGDPSQSVLEQLIERQLQLAEVNRYVPAEPDATTIETRFAALRARFPSEAAFTAALANTGTTERQLRAAIRDSLRIDSYLQQRFGGSYQPGDGELMRYYRAHEADFARNGALAPYESVRDDVRRRVIAERMEALVRTWVTDLRRRSEVTLLPK